MICPVCRGEIRDGDAVTVIGISNHALPGTIQYAKKFHAKCVDVQIRFDGPWLASRKQAAMPQEEAR